MAFDAEKATWIDTAGVCSGFGGNNCKGMLGIDPNNRQKITCPTINCPAQLPKTALAVTVEKPTL